MYQDIVDFIRHHYNAKDGETVMPHAPKFAGNEKSILTSALTPLLFPALDLLLTDLREIWRRIQEL